MTKILLSWKCLPRKDQLEAFPALSSQPTSTLLFGIKFLQLHDLEAFKLTMNLKIGVLATAMLSPAFSQSSPPPGTTTLTTAATTHTVAVGAVSGFYP
jgi:hypothetical protein